MLSKKIRIAIEKILKARKQIPIDKKIIFFLKISKIFQKRAK